MRLQATRPCSRCGIPAECPSIGFGQVAGGVGVEIILCEGCHEMMLLNTERFWREPGMWKETADGL